MTHSQLPWIHDEDFIWSADKRAVAELDRYESKAPSRDDMALIVTAVNAHYYLVESLQECSDYIQNILTVREFEYIDVDAIYSKSLAILKFATTDLIYDAPDITNTKTTHTELVAALEKIANINKGKTIFYMNSAEDCSKIALAALELACGEK
jgi:hypothetical protein